MSPPLEVARAQVLAYRARALGLSRRARDLAALAVVDLGVQDTPRGSAALALAARLGRPVELSAGEALAWSWRGAPHVHRTAGLQQVADATWPLSDRDALARLGGAGRTLQAAGRPAGEAFALAVRTMAEVVDRPMSKGEASGLVTRRLPAELVGFCRTCGVVHVGELVFRSAALAAGLQLQPGPGPLTLAPIEAWAGSAPDPAATAAALRSYLRMLGPGTPAGAAGFVGTQPADAKRIWPAGLTEVSVEGRTGWFPEELVDDLRTAAPLAAVRLLPPSDPYLQGRDRDLLVPDRAQQRELWRALGNPGAVLVGGEIAGTWRPKRAGARLTLTVAPFAALSPAARTAVAEEAALVGAVRGAATAEVVFTG